MKTLLLIAMLWSFGLMLFTQSPLGTMMMILAAAISSSAMLWSNPGKWFAITLVLLYAGGMMVAFSYFMTSFSLYKIWSFNKVTTLVLLALTCFFFENPQTYNAPSPLSWNHLYCQTGLYALWGGAAYLMVALLASAKIGGGGVL